MQVPDVLELLRGEWAEGREALDRSLATVVQASTDDPALMEALDECSAQVGGLGAGAQAAGLPGLQAICERFQEHLLEFGAWDDAQRRAGADLLSAWPERLDDYLQAPTEVQPAARLAAHLADERWPDPLTEDEATALAELLAESVADEAGFEEPARPREATPQDVALLPGDDVNDEVLSAFIHDAPSHTADLCNCIQRLVRAPDDRQSLDRARRIAHTLKGAANVVGIAGVANLTHHLEDILDYLMDRQHRPGPGLLQTLADGGDCVAAMVDAVLGLEEPPAEAQAVLQRILDWARRADQGALEEADAQAAPSPPAAERSEAPPPAAPESAGAALAAAARDEATAQALRVPVGTVDQLFRVTGELAVSTAQMDESLNRFKQVQGLFGEQDQKLQDRLLELEDLVDVRAVTAGGFRLGGAAPGNAGDSFDDLEMDRYTELHSASRALAEAIADWRELRRALQDELGRLRNHLSDHQRLNRSLQDVVLDTRMVPARSILPRLQRGLRQACRLTGREAELTLSGEDLPVDAAMLNGLAEPLLHLLRNAVAHGIEDPAQREARGKPPQGCIRLEFQRRGNLVEVRCSDDGAGLDFPAIRERAAQRGLLPEDAAADPETLARLVLLPGFSTRTQVSQVAGRGVGLDVVAQWVGEHGGTLELSSEPGTGATARLRVPATLVTVHVLLVEAAGQVFAVPSGDLLNVPVPGSARRRQQGEDSYLETAGERHPLVSLEQLLGRQATARPGPAAGDTPPALMMETPEGTRAVAVDRLVGSAEVVIKAFGTHMPRPRGVLGGAILRDGTVAPVLDLQALLALPREAQTLAVAAEVLEAPRRHSVLVADDSLSVRKSLTDLLSDWGYEVRPARDGMEAVQLMDESRPDILLVDLEMPRMNGLELTAHLRDQDSTRDLPVIMITSRAMEKHRRRASEVGVDVYLTKPYRDTDLLREIEQQLSRSPVA